MKKFLALLLCMMLMTGSAAFATSFFTSEYYTTYIKATASVNLRTGPGTQYMILGSMQADEVLPYANQTSTDYRGIVWYKVSYKNTYAWVSGMYSYVTNNASVVTPDTYVRATASVNLRTGPGMGYKDIGTLARGEQVLYLDQSAYDANGIIWYKVKYYSFGEGWISGKYSKLVTDISGGVDEQEDRVVGTYVKATNGQSNLRSGPGLNYEDLGTLHKGETAPYLGAYATDERGVVWYYISLNGQTGWISSRYTTLY